VNYDQVSRTRVHFKTNRAELTKAAQERLDLVVLYAKEDPDVTSFFVDGHTDNVAGRLYNLELSKKRAEAVTAYLVANGIPQEMVTTRYHGERYPVKKNNSRANRSYNRRVTIRLDKAEGI
jgi:outer membrane protein OmpA-like peptidoglycan-associated protein